MFHGPDKETGPRNPKITALPDKINNDTPDEVDVASQKSLPNVAVKQNLSSNVIQLVIPQQTLPTPFPMEKVDRETQPISRSYS